MTTQFVISFESLLILESGEETWYSDEFTYPSKNQQSINLLKMLTQMQHEGQIRNLREIDRVISDWLV